MMKHVFRKKITIVIPALNEEKGIASVIQGVPRQVLNTMGYAVEVLVIDNGSEDKTGTIAQKNRATVILEKKRGKGNALRTGFRVLSSDTTIVVMLDGDNSYKTKEIVRLIEPLENGFSDVIIGSRLGGKIRKGSFKLQNRIANWLYTFLVRHFYRANVTDVLSGYFSWKKEVIDKLLPYLCAEGFEVEMEMITKMVKLGYEIYSVPITYDRREGRTKLRVMQDGVRIFSIFLKNLTWSPR